MKNIAVLDGSKAQELIPFAISKMNPIIKAQLSDYWIAYSVLGIPDFHPGNWLIHEGKVIGIDAAIPAKDWNNPLKLIDHQHPFGMSELTESIRNILMRSASPELKQYLRSLGREDVTRMAAHSGYSLSEQGLDQIMSRIQYVNNYDLAH